MKQVIEIEVPEGKKAVYEDGKITFIPAESWRDITTFRQAFEYLMQNNLRCDLVKDYCNRNPESYAKTIIKYQIVIAALTNNEESHLTTGDRWYPIIQFCRPKDKKNCWGSKIIGTIESEGERYLVIKNIALRGGSEGIGCFASISGVSTSQIAIGLRSVPSLEIAEHISEYFGRLLFEVHFGGTNCSWKWID